MMRNIGQTLAPLLAASVIAGCSGGGETDSSAIPSPESGAAQATAAPLAFPRIASCEQLAGVMPASRIEGLPLDEETSYVGPDEISCTWAARVEDLAPLDFGGIRSFAVDISVGDAEVPDPAVAAQLGINMYFTDPRLDALGGVGLWIPVNPENPVRGGSGGVLVPGIEITIAGGGWGTGNEFSREEMLEVALKILDP